MSFQFNELNNTFSYNFPRLSFSFYCYLNANKRAFICRACSMHIRQLGLHLTSRWRSVVQVVFLIAIKRSKGGIYGALKLNPC